MYTLELVALVSFVFAYLLTPSIRGWFLKIGWLDRPDGDRKMHATPVPRVGGIAIALAYLGTYGILAILRLNGWKVTPIDFGLVLSILPGAAVVFLIGLLDDKRTVRPWVKLVVQVAAALVAFAGGLHVKIFHLAFVEKWWVSLPLTLFWLVLCTNAFNLIDGMDGLSSGLGLCATITLICVATIHHNYALLLATIPLAGALLGFLPYNSNPASVFLGDCGSYALGFLLGCFGIVWSQESATLLGLTAPIVCFAVPLLDLLLAVTRRLLSANPLFGPDRLHVHHRLLDRGLTPRRAVLILYASAAVAAAFALLSTLLRDTYASLVLIPFFCSVWLGVRNLGGAGVQAVDPVVLFGRARHVLLSDKIVQTARKKLRTAQNLHTRWDVLRSTAGQLGFCYVATTLEGVNFFESFDAVDESPAWIVTIPLEGGGKVQLAHRQEKHELATTSLGALTELLRTHLTPPPEHSRTAEEPLSEVCSFEKVAGD